MKIRLALILLFIVPLLPSATAQNEMALANCAAVISQDTPSVGGNELIASQRYPCHSVPPGHRFVWTGNVWTDATQVATVNVAAIALTGDCTIISQTTSTLALFKVWRVEIEMGQSSCGFSRQLFAQSAIGAEQARLIVSGNVAPYQLIDYGQTSSGAFFAFTVWQWFFLAIFLWGGYTEQRLVMLAGLVGFLAEIVPQVPMDRVFFILLALLAASLPALKMSWEKYKERNTT